jgi:hypothetical protein
MKKYNILGSFQVSNKSKAGIDDFVSALISTASKLPFTHDIYPKTYLDLISWVENERKTHPILSAESFMEKALVVLKSQQQLPRIMTVLHDLGIIMRYKQLVLLDPNWLNKLFTTVITVDTTKNQLMDSGVLFHDKLPWKALLEEKNVEFKDPFVFLQMMFEFKIAFPVSDASSDKAIKSLVPARTFFYFF